MLSVISWFGEIANSVQLAVACYLHADFASTFNGYVSLPFYCLLECPWTCIDNILISIFIGRKATAEILCMQCLKIQPVGPVCSIPSCGKYFCY
jgi:hypothetical protein